MVFVNEFISRDDMEKYGIREINKKYLKMNSRNSWTIDRERNIYLRYMMSGREDLSNLHTFTFFWGGELFEVQLFGDGYAKRGGSGLSIWRPRLIDIPSKFSERREEILGDLKEALTEYKEAGVFTTVEQHAVRFEF